MIICVDFDGTLCTNEFPGIGEANKPLIDLLMKRSIESGDEIILFTCREGKYLDEAIEWCRTQGLYIDGANCNAPSITWTCRKPYADIYIDDRSLTPDAFVRTMTSLSGKNIKMEVSIEET